MSDQSQFSASKALWANRGGAGAAPPPVVPQFSARNLAPAPAVVGGSVGGSVGGADAAPAVPPEVKRPPPAPARVRVAANLPAGGGASAAAAAGAAAAAPARPEPVVGAPNAQASAQAAALLANGGELSFATHLTQSFEVVAKQTANGLQAVRDFYNLTKKLVAKQDEYGKGILKLIKSDGLKPAKDDGMRNIFIAWNAAQDALAKEGQQHINQAALLVQEIVVPVMEYIESMDANRKSLLAQERAASGEMAAARDAAKKAELNVVKMLESAKESLAKEKEPNKPSGMLAKIGASLAKATARTAADLQAKAHQAAVQYQEAVSAANARQAKYLNVDLPSIFKGMQTLEFGRIDFLKALLTKYATLLRDNTTPLKQIAEHFLEGAQSMDAKADIHSFIAKWVREHGMPVPTAPFTYNLSCTPDDIKAGRFEGNPNSVFNNSLQRCMELQRASAPGMDVPRILPALIAMVKELRGVTTEGIFRISPTKMDLDALLKQVDEQGVYELTPQQRAPGALTPHVPAALLKQWMRSLTDPLVPENLYAQCIALAKDKDTQPQAVLQLYGQFPSLNRKVIDQLGALVREMTVPAAAKANRMGAESFAIVFSPSFFRMNAAADPIEILQNSKFETRFCLLLFKALGAYDAVAAADDQPGAAPALAAAAPAPVIVTHVEGGAFGEDAGAAAGAGAAPATPSSSGLALAPAAGAAAAGLGSGPKPPLPRPLPKPGAPKPGGVAAHSQTLRSPPPPVPPPRKASLPSVAKAQAAAAAASAAHAGAAAEPNSTAQPDFLSGDGDVR